MKTILLPLIFAMLLAPLPLQAAEQKAPADMANLAIPETLGKIEERFQGQGKRWVINIQDVHAHFGAQENIAAILEHLNEIYGLRLVAYEGGWSNSSFSETWELPPSREKQLVLRTLLEEDVITGAAFAAMTSKMPIMLHGVEDADLYKKNLKVYLEFLNQKEAVEKQAADFQASLARQKTSVYNAGLLQFDRELLKFREDPKTAEKFFPRLLSQAQASGLDLDSLPQLRLFHQITSLEKSIEKDKLKSEAQRLMQEHKNSRLSFEEMLRHGSFTDEKLSFYPNAQKQKELLHLQDGIIHDQLFEEIEKAVGLIKEKLFQTDAERELDAQFNRFMTARKIMLFKAAPADIKQYSKAKAEIRAEMAAAGLDPFLTLGLRFYRLAQKRDQVFFEKISADPELTGEDIALVAGGFHTDGIRERLRKAGISYLVITPSLGEESADEALYFKRLQGLQVLTQTLSELGNQLTERGNRIPEAFRRYKDGTLPNINQVVDYVLGNGMVLEAKSQLSQKSFLSLSADEQRKAVNQAVESLLTGEMPVSVVMQAEALQKILETSPLGAALLKAAMENPANHMTVLSRSFSEVPPLISDAFDKPNVKTLGETSLDRAIARQRDLQAAVKRHSLAVIADDYDNSGVLILKETVLALLLFRPLLEQGWIFAWDDPASQNAIANLVEEALAAKGFSLSA